MKTVIVTGANGNLGSAVVKKFIQQGFFVCGTSLHPSKTGDDPSSDMFEQTIVNLEDEVESEKFIHKIVEKYHTIDAAVLTVGGFAKGTISNTTTADIKKQYQLNFETAYNVAKPVFEQMMKQGNGRIFMIGSKQGLSPKKGKGVVAYALAKSLLFRLAEIMNVEAQGKNVVTIVVIPSTIDTSSNREGMPDAQFEDWVKAESIADVIYWYCTSEASAIREPVIKIYNNA
jgi:NAD(P)-dependent dehydrogenase (short-subunit alcohol dehydrogenase family)